MSVVHHREVIPQIVGSAWQLLMLWLLLLASVVVIVEIVSAPVSVAAADVLSVVAIAPRLLHVLATALGDLTLIDLRRAVPPSALIARAPFGREVVPTDVKVGLIARAPLSARIRIGVHRRHRRHAHRLCRLRLRLGERVGGVHMWRRLLWHGYSLIGNVLLAVGHEVDHCCNLDRKVEVIRRRKVALRRKSTPTLLDFVLQLC